LIYLLELTRQDIQNRDGNERSHVPHRFHEYERLDLTPFLLRTEKLLCRFVCVFVFASWIRSKF